MYTVYRGVCAGDQLCVISNWVNGNMGNENRKKCSYFKRHMGHNLSPCAQTCPNYSRSWFTVSSIIRDGLVNHWTLGRRPPCLSIVHLSLNSSSQTVSQPPRTPFPSKNAYHDAPNHPIADYTHLDSSTDSPIYMRTQNSTQTRSIAPCRLLPDVPSFIH